MGADVISWGQMSIHDITQHHWQLDEIRVDAARFIDG